MTHVGTLVHKACHQGTEFLDNSSKISYIDDFDQNFELVAFNFDTSPDILSLTDLFRILDFYIFLGNKNKAAKIAKLIVLKPEFQNRPVQALIKNRSQYFNKSKYNVRRINEKLTPYTIVDDLLLLSDEQIGSLYIIDKFAENLKVTADAYYDFLWTNYSPELETLMSDFRAPSMDQMLRPSLSLLNNVHSKDELIKLVWAAPTFELAVIAISKITDFKYLNTSSCLVQLFIEREDNLGNFIIEDDSRKTIIQRVLNTVEKANPYIIYNSLEYSPMYYACLNGIKSIYKLLYKKFDFKSSNKEAESVFHALFTIPPQCDVDAKLDIAYHILNTRKDINLNKRTVKTRQTSLHLLAINENQFVLDEILQQKYKIFLQLFLSKMKGIGILDSDLKTALMLACEHRSWILAKELLKKPNIDVTTEDIFQCSVFHYACRSLTYDISILKTLLQKTDCNIKNSMGETPLHCLLKRDPIDDAEYWRVTVNCINLLNPTSAQLNTQDNNGDTPINICAQKLLPQGIFTLLLKLGADPNIANNKKETPLYNAAKFLTNKELATKALDICKLLIVSGSDPNIRSIIGLLPYDISGYNPELKKFISLADKNDLYIFDALYNGIPQKYAKDVKETMLSDTSLANIQDENGNTLIMCAAKANNLIVASQLLEDADITIVNHKGEALSQYIIEMQFIDLIKQIFEKDSNLMHKALNQNGEKPIHIISRVAKSEEILDFFMDKKPDLLEKDNNGFNPFLSACKAGNILAVKYYCKKYFEPEPTEYGSSLVKIIRRMFICKDNHHNSGIYWACYSLNTELVKYLLSKNIYNISNKNDEKETIAFAPLHATLMTEEMEAKLLTSKQMESIIERLVAKTATISASIVKRTQQFESKQANEQKEFKDNCTKKLEELKQKQKQQFHDIDFNINKEITKLEEDKAKQIQKLDKDYKAMKLDFDYKIRTASSKDDQNNLKDQLNEYHQQYNMNLTNIIENTSRKIQDLNTTIKEKRSKQLMHKQKQEEKELNKLLQTEEKQFTERQNNDREQLERLLEEDKSNLADMKQAIERLHREIQTINVSNEQSRAILQENQKDMMLLLASKVTLNTQKSDGMNPLMLACQNDCHIVVPSIVPFIKDINLKMKTGSTALHYACKTGNIESVKAIIARRDINVNIATRKGQTPILMACSTEGKSDENVYQIVSLLLGKGANPNDYNRAGKNCLIYAAQNGYSKTSQLLIENGANPDYTDNQFNTPLLTSIESNHENVTSVLIKNKADITISNIADSTAAHIACKSFNSDILGTIITQQKNYNLTDIKGKTSFFVACEYGNLKAVETFMSEDPDHKLIYMASYEGKTPFLVACENGRTEIVKYLLENALSNDEITYMMSETDVSGNFPIHRAAKKGEPDLFSVLLKPYSLRHERLVREGKTDILEQEEDLSESFSDFEITNNSGETPIITACQNGHKTIVYMLNDLGARIFVNEPFGVKMLNSCCHYGYFDLIIDLHNMGLPLTLSQYSANGLSPLYIACLYGKFDVVKYLLKHKEVRSDLSPREPQKHPINACIMRSHETIFFYLLDYVDDLPAVQPNLNFACSKGLTRIVNELLVLDVLGNNEKNLQDSIPCLYNACIKGEIEIVQMILNIPKICNVKSDYVKTLIYYTDESGWTPLHIATFYQHMDVIRLILSKLLQLEDKFEVQAYVNIQTVKGDTPLSIACQNSNLELVDYFLSKGASIQDTSNDNNSLAPSTSSFQNKEKQMRSPLSSAASSSNYEIVQRLYTSVKSATIMQIQSSDGLEALNETVDNEQIEILFAAIKNNNPNSRKIINFILEQNPLYKQIGKRKIFVSKYVKNGISLLHAACIYGQDELINKFFVPSRSFLNMEIQDGWNLLLIAAFTLNEELVQNLVSKFGCDTDMYQNKLKRKKHKIKKFSKLWAKKNDIFKVFKDYMWGMPFLTDDNFITIEILTQLCKKRGTIDLVELILDNIRTRTESTKKNKRRRSRSSSLTESDIGEENILYDILEEEDVIDNEEENEMELEEQNAKSLKSQLKNKKKQFSQKLKEYHELDLAEHISPKPFFAAVEAGNLDIVHLFLSKDKVDILQTDDEGKTALYLAIECGHMNVAEALLEKGTAQINVPTKNEKTPLIIAAEKGYFGIIQKLVALGATIADIDKNNRTAIFYACENKNFEIVQFLVEAGSTVFDSDNNSVTLLHICAATGDLTSFSYLYDKGADINAVNSLHETPLITAIREENTNIVQFCIDTHKININHLNVENHAAIHYACLVKNINILSLILSVNGLDPLIKNDKGETCFDIAYNLSFIEGIYELDKYAHSKGIKFYERKSLLAYTCEHPNSQLFDDLVTKLTFDDLINYDEKYNTVLHYAMLGGNEHIIEELVKKAGKQITIFFTEYDNFEEQTILHPLFQLWSRRNPLLRKITFDILLYKPKLSECIDYWGKSVFDYISPVDIEDFFSFINEKFFTYLFANYKKKTVSTLFEDVNLGFYLPQILFFTNKALDLLISCARKETAFETIIISMFISRLSKSPLKSEINRAVEKKYLEIIRDEDDNDIQFKTLLHTAYLACGIFLQKKFYIEDSISKLKPKRMTRANAEKLNMSPNPFTDNIIKILTIYYYCIDKKENALYMSILKSLQAIHKYYMYTSILTPDLIIFIEKNQKHIKPIINMKNFLVQLCQKNREKTIKLNSSGSQAEFEQPEVPNYDLDNFRTSKITKPQEKVKAPINKTVSTFNMAPAPEIETNIGGGFSVSKQPKNSLEAPTIIPNLPKAFRRSAFQTSENTNQNIDSPPQFDLPKETKTEFNSAQSPFINNISPTTFQNPKPSKLKDTKSSSAFEDEYVIDDDAEATFSIIMHKPEDIDENIKSLEPSIGTQPLSTSDKFDYRTPPVSMSPKPVSITTPIDHDQNVHDADLDSLHPPPMMNRQFMRTRDLSNMSRRSIHTRRKSQLPEFDDSTLKPNQQNTLTGLENISAPPYNENETNSSKIAYSKSTSHALIQKPPDENTDETRRKSYGAVSGPNNFINMAQKDETRRSKVSFFFGKHKESVAKIPNMENQSQPQVQEQEQQKPQPPPQASAPTRWFSKRLRRSSASESKGSEKEATPEVDENFLFDQDYFAL